MFTIFRNVVGGVLLGIGGAATIVMVALAPPNNDNDPEKDKADKKSPIQVISPILFCNIQI